MCGLEGQGAGVRIDGCDENHVQIRFVPVGVPAGGFIVVIPAVNEIIAVRVAVQRPAFAGIAKGDGGTVCVVDVVTRKPCVIVVQLYIVREDCGALVTKSAALITGMVIAYTAGQQVQRRMLIVLDTAVAVVFHLQIGTLFHGEEIAVEDTGHRIVVGSDICAAFYQKSALLQLARFLIVDAMGTVVVGGDICTGLNRQIGIVTVVDTELSIVVH